MVLVVVDTDFELPKHRWQAWLGALGIPGLPAPGQAMDQAVPGTAQTAPGPPHAAQVLPIAFLASSISGPSDSAAVVSSSMP